MNRYRGQRGASIVHWLIALIPLLGFGAFAIDLNNLYGAHTELQAAADAGALEGARTLHCADTGELNHAGCPDGSASAATSATEAATANISRGVPVELVSAELGHWEFRPNPSAPTVPVVGAIERGGVFTPSNNTSQTNLFYTNAAGLRKPRPFTGNDPSITLNNDTSWINAVRVTVAREDTPVASTLAGLLGINQFEAQATSVAYATFPNRIESLGIDFPIAMCEEILDDGCNVGRLVPSTEQTGGWSDVNPPTGACSGAVNASTLQGLVANSVLCGSSSGINPNDITLGTEIRVNNGQVNSAFTDAYNCWMNDTSLDTNGDGWPDKTVTMTMPVVAGCSYGGQCAPVIGAVEVELIWMFLNDPTNQGVNNINNTAPKRMTGSEGATWSDNSTDGTARWNSFVAFFNLLINASTPATVANGGAVQKTMYFRPLCKPVQLLGSSTVNWYGNLSAVPVLVY